LAELTAHYFSNAFNFSTLQSAPSTSFVEGAL